MKKNGFQLKFEDRGTYLYAYLTGRDSFAASLNYWNQIADMAKKLKHNKLLVHENLIGEVSESEIFEIMIDVVPAGIGIQIAFFDENRSDISINELGELIASNRGANIQIFQSLEEATLWIEYDSQDTTHG